MTVVARDVARWYRNALAGLVLSAAAGAGMLVTGGVDPMDQMLSDVVGSPAGAVLLAFSACALAVSAAWIAVGARRSLPRDPRLTGLLTCWGAGLVGVAVFPTNLPGAPVTVDAVVHRGSAAVVAVLPPVIALLVAQSAGSRALRAAAFTTMAACAVFGAVNAPAFLGGTGLPPYAGLAERLLLAMVLLVTALTAYTVKTAGRTLRCEICGRPLSAVAFPRGTRMPSPFRVRGDSGVLPIGESRHGGHETPVAVHHEQTLVRTRGRIAAVRGHRHAGRGWRRSVPGCIRWPGW
ncbi:DUF998 domain-containing protein [Actinoplanes rectilineatus]|uniref:DUF998 domain-containing protein n=1 Tax=Actinoplanes rectilineatus TaxID=113571 RepID=UPI0005F2D757|nr:DUF998 domain-containing protein [Actinoplanes rectilineatus]